MNKIMLVGVALLWVSAPVAAMDPDSVYPVLIAQSYASDDSACIGDCAATVESYRFDAGLGVGVPLGAGFSLEAAIMPEGRGIASSLIWRHDAGPISVGAGIGLMPVYHHYQWSPLAAAGVSGNIGSAFVELSTASPTMRANNWASFLFLRAGVARGDLSGSDTEVLGTDADGNPIYGASYNARIRERGHFAHIGIIVVE